MCAFGTPAIFPPVADAQHGADAIEQAMKTAVLKQARALEDKDIDRYMSYVHPDAPNRDEMEQKVRSGMKLGPAYGIVAKPVALDVKSMVTVVEVSFSRREIVRDIVPVAEDENGTIVAEVPRSEVVTKQVTLTVQFHDHGGTPMIWRKSASCSNPGCKKGRVHSVQRHVVGTDPASGRQFYMDSPHTEKCPVCGGKGRVEWQDVP
jgi:hypothetical protein